MKKAIIIDDELFCIEVLVELIKEHCPLLQVAATAQSGEEGVKKIKEHSPDIVFLDIEMPRMGGFDLLEKLMPVPFAVVFTTAYDNHAIRAFKYSAMDYLLKPIDAADLKAAVDKFLTTATRQNYTEQFSLLKENIRQLNLSHIQRIAIPTVDGLTMQPVQDIVYCEASSSYTILHIKGKAKIISAKTLKEYEEILDVHGFFRVHHSHLINMNFVEKYVRGDGGYVILSDGTEVAVSRSKKDALVSKLQQM